MGAAIRPTLANVAKIAEKPEMQLEDDEVTANNDFQYRRSEDACGVVIDCNSDEGRVQISGKRKQLAQVETGLEHHGYEFRQIQTGQSCMLYGRPTVLFLRHRQ